MSGFAAIDLDKLPAADIIQPLDYEQILSELKADLIARAPALIEALQYESEPLNKLLEITAYRELTLRQRINEAAKAVMLAYAKKAELDNLGALFAVTRLVSQAADPDAIPPIAAQYETDNNFRRRIQLSLEGFSTAGPAAAYVFHALSADARIKDVSVISPSPGEVTITILSTENTGTASADLIAIVYQVLNDEDVRPLTDHISVQSASIEHYQVTATLILFNGPDAQLVKQQAESSCAQYVNTHHKLGHDITLSGLYAALHQPGVQQVILTSPNADQVIDDSLAAYCDNINIAIGGRNE